MAAYSSHIAIMNQTSIATPAHRLCLAPMLDWTDRHFRYFLRQITGQMLLYTEMVTTGAIIHGNREHHLGHHPAEHPIALQLGGSEPAELAECTRIAAEYGYDEVNLNIGCPSDRVQSGRFGACLMAEPQRVADCVASMTAAAKLPITVKHRIGIDDNDSYQALCHFISTVAQAGCERFIVHARKAWLQGLSPRENRDIPPLRYDLVYQLKQDFPALQIIINGGILDLDSTLQHLDHVDGVMIGRAAYHDPYLLATADLRVYGNNHAIPSRHDVVERMIPYIEQHLASGQRLQHITRHMLGLFQGCNGARRWRRHLSEHGPHRSSGVKTLLEAAKMVTETHPGQN